MFGTIDEKAHVRSGRCPCDGARAQLHLDAADGAPKPGPDPEYVRKMIPEKISGKYQGGELLVMRVHDRNAYIIKPTARSTRRSAGCGSSRSGSGSTTATAGCTTGCTSRSTSPRGSVSPASTWAPRAAARPRPRCATSSYEKLKADFGLNPRVRLEVQSNGGLIGYAWAFRHPDCVDRIGGICPVTDFRTWPPPGLTSVLSAPDKGLGYNLTLEQLTARQAEFNPIDNLAPLAKAGVKILHIHGDKDDLVPMSANSTELAKRYKALGGSAQVVVIPGLGHGGQVLYESQPLLKFLLSD